MFIFGQYKLPEELRDIFASSLLTETSHFEPFSPPYEL